jgi:hypothetical protein|tara:strand:- start:1164 stop:1484 length:321 start_codon:yes stop_codon:yes gene_type:complete
MEMRQEKSVYSFMTREGEEDSAFRINEGKFKGTIYKYSNINLPKEDNGNLRLSFKFDILDSAGHTRELYEDDWVELIGDILADQIDERMDSEQLVFRHNSTEDDPL